VTAASCDISKPRHSVGLKKLLILLALGFDIVLPISSSIAFGQHRTVKIGILEPGGSGATARPGCNLGVRQGLREFGWNEGENLHIEERHAAFQNDRLTKMAAELARITPALIWTHSPPAVHAAKRATTTIPIVIGVASDIVEQGIIPGSLSRPGGNITGMELRDMEIMGRRLELLKEALPLVSRVTVVVDPANSTHVRVPENFESDARALKIQLQRVEVSTPDEIDSVFGNIRADAVLIPEGAMFSQNRARLFQAANRKRLPTIAGGQQFAESGGLLSYGANIVDTCRRSAVFVDKILKGAKAGELPIQRPTKFDFVVNLKTAKQIGLTIPPSVLARADKVLR
jgi:putative tryptophan/tyrosine transport system substrate-binding protein